MPTLKVHEIVAQKAKEAKVKKADLFNDLVTIASVCRGLQRTYACQDQSEEQLAEDIGEKQARLAFAMLEYIDTVLAKAVKDLE